MVVTCSTLINNFHASRSIMAKIVNLRVGELKLALVMLLSLYYVVSMSPPVIGAKIPEWVLRRYSGDIYSYINSSEYIVAYCGSTFLVNENQCVKDQELFDGN